MTRTPTPWKTYIESDDRYPGIEAESQSIVVYGMAGEDCGIRGNTRKEALENAEFIVTAVNSHDGLLEALETAANLISGQRDVLVADPDHDPALAAAAVIIRRRIQRAIKEAQ